MSDETPRDEWRDDGFVAFLRRHGDAVNRPPETPVESIWEGIREAREHREEETRPIPIATWRRILPILAVAAVLVFGITLGRISMRQAAEREAPAGPTVAARAEAPASGAASGAGRPAGATPLAGAVPQATMPTAVPGADLAAAPSGARPAGPGPARPVYAARAESPAAAPTPSSPEAPADVRDLYRLASIQMLAQAEALLVDYRSGRASGRTDAEAIGGWARDVLASTRLLLDSRAARDPEMRGLLEDLELVLAQIVHRTGADPLEGEMIDRSIEERDLIPRLRTAIPSGGAPIGT